MTKTRLEFGSLEHIATLRDAEEKHKALEAALEKGPVGTRSIDVCGECGSDIDNYSTRVRTDGKMYLMCTCCDSIIQ